MKRLAAYCRVSTDRQKEEQTIEVQKRFIEEWAAKNDAVIVAWYLDDGWSGELLARPDLDRLRDDAKKRSWQGVVFIDRDRLARKLSLQELIIDELTEIDIEVILLNEALADNPEERIMQQIKGVFAEYERAKITERMRRGKMHKAKSGKIVGYSAPYGYRYILKSGEVDGYFVINEPEAEIVKKIFHWVADDGYSMYRVIQELYKRGITPPKKKSEYWRKSAVERLLNRKDYIGITYYNKGVAVVPKNPQKVGEYKKVKKSSRKLKPKEEWVEILDTTPVIIDKELFEKAHEQLKKNKLQNPRNRKYPYMLSGKVFCTCGARRVGDGVNGHHYYRCAARIHKFPLPNPCKSEGVNAEILDEMVWVNLLKTVNNPELIKSQYAKWLRKQEKMLTAPQNELSQAKRALEALDEEEDRYTEAYGAGLISFEKYQELMAEVKAKRKVIEEQTQEVLVSDTTNYPPIDAVDRVCADMAGELRTAKQNERQKYMQNLVQSIYVEERRNAIVNGYIPVYSQAQNIQYESISRDCWITECREVHAF